MSGEKKTIIAGRIRSTSLIFIEFVDFCYKSSISMDLYKFYSIWIDFDIFGTRWPLTFPSKDLEQKIWKLWITSPQMYPQPDTKGQGSQDSVSRHLHCLCNQTYTYTTIHQNAYDLKVVHPPAAVRSPQKITAKGVLACAMSGVTTHVLLKLIALLFSRCGICLCLGRHWFLQVSLYLCTAILRHWCT